MKSKGIKRNCVEVFFLLEKIRMKCNFNVFHRHGTAFEIKENNNYKYATRYLLHHFLHNWYNTKLKLINELKLSYSMTFFIFFVDTTFLYLLVYRAWSCFKLELEANFFVHIKGICQNKYRRWHQWVKYILF